MHPAQAMMNLSHLMLLANRVVLIVLLIIVCVSIFFVSYKVVPLQAAGTAMSGVC